MPMLMPITLVHMQCSLQSGYLWLINIDPLIVFCEFYLSIKMSNLIDRSEHSTGTHSPCYISSALVTTTVLHIKPILLEFILKAVVFIYIKLLSYVSFFSVTSYLW